MRGRIVTVLIVVVVAVLCFGVGRMSAANGPNGLLDPPGPPGSTLSYTLEDIWNRLTAGTEGSQNTFSEPSSGPTAGTMHTLNDIMAAVPAPDNANGATAADVRSGKTFWGLTSGTWGVQTGTANVSLYPAPARKTGQTTSYAVGDDGDLERGVAWPNPRFTDNGNGTVTDNLTGLIWTQRQGCDARDWSNALAYANGLGNGVCFLSDGSAPGDWRLPNAQELLTLVDYGNYAYALPTGHPFAVSFPSIYPFWTSTSVSYDSSRALVVNMYHGGLETYTKANNGFVVWPVKNGP